jgi:hypothetical protein
MYRPGSDDHKNRAHQLYPRSASLPQCGQNPCPSKALWTVSTTSQMLSMPLTGSLVNRPTSSTLCCGRSPPIWSLRAPSAANLALEKVAQKTINYLPNLVKKCTPPHTRTGRRINPKCALYAPYLSAIRARRLLIAELIGGATILCRLIICPRETILETFIQNVSVRLFVPC